MLFDRPLRGSQPLLLATLFVVGCAAAPSQEDSTSEPVTSAPSTSTIQNTNDGLCFDVQGASKAIGAPLIQYTCSGNANQEFSLVLKANGFYNVEDKNSGNCVRPVAGGTANGTRLDLEACDATLTSEEYSAREVATGVYTLVNNKSGRCVDVPGRAATVGLQLQIYDCNSTPAQTFAFSLGGGGAVDMATPAHDAATHESDMSEHVVPAFYVATTGSDGNEGSLTAPFATLGKAQAAMQASSTVKTTYLRKGSYKLPTIASCSGSNCGLNLTSADDGETWSYYPPDGVDSADLSAGSTSGSNGLVVAIYVSASNVTIDGLSIHDFAYAGINSNGGANNLVIENNLIFNGYYASNSSNPGGISLSDCANVTISHNVIHDIAMLGSSVIASSAHPNISNLLVTGNVVYDTCTANADCGAIYVQDVTATQTNLRVTDNYIHDGNTFAGLGSNSGSAIYADDCTSNVTETGNLISGRNGSNTFMVHGGSNVHQTGNLVDLATFGQHAAVFQTSGVSGCSNAAMSGNEYANNIIISGGGGGGYSLLSGSPTHAPTIEDNDYFNYAGAAISTGSGSYGDSAPTHVNPELSGWNYTIAAGSGALASPVSFAPLVGAWGPPGYVLPESGTAPSSPH